MAYTFEIKCRKTGDNANVDRFSAFFFQQTFDKDESYFQISFDDFAIEVDIQKYLKSDKTLHKVYNYVKNSWLERLSSERWIAEII